MLEINDVTNTEKALLNILDDYSEEKKQGENVQKAFLNIIDDFSNEKINLENTQRAILNILEDYAFEKVYMENTQRGVINILEDYSVEKVKMENAQRAVFNILEDYALEKEKVESTNKNLTLANQELEQITFIAAHHLQEPLRTISNYVELLEEEYSETEDNDKKFYFKFIASASSRMQSLIKDLMNYSRVEKDIVFETVDCNRILKEVLEDLATSIKESNAKVTVATLPVLKGNHSRLKQLFRNLIDNAIKFRRKDSTPVIEVNVEDKGSEYLFSVKDNGIGIEEQNIKKLFNIFQRLNSAEEYPGTGIGLSTVKKIVNLHNGQICVESRYNEGSIFYFTIRKS